MTEDAPQVPPINTTPPIEQPAVTVANPEAAPADIEVEESQAAGNGIHSALVHGPRRVSHADTILKATAGTAKLTGEYL